MAIAPSFFHQFTPSPTTNPLRHERSFTLRASASSLALPFNVNYLEREFGGHGVNFKEIGDCCVVKIGLENKRVASLMLPSGLITSYKPFMWRGRKVLHTTVSEGENGEVVMQGEVCMDLSCVSDDGSSWSSNKWVLLDVKWSSEQSIQVDVLISIGSKDTAEVKCLVTIQEDLLGSEISVSNKRSSSLQLLVSVKSHLTLSTPGATYAVGLHGSSYLKQPRVSNFSIVPPELREEKEFSFQTLAQKGFDALFSSWDKRGRVHDEESMEEGEEDNDYAQMTWKMCRIYTHAPRVLTIMDSVRISLYICKSSKFL